MCFFSIFLFLLPCYRFRATNENQCEQSSDLMGCAFIVQFLVTIPKIYNTNHLRQKFLLNVQSNIRYVYNRFTLLMQTEDGRPVTVHLGFCFLGLITGMSLSTRVPLIVECSNDEYTFNVA